MTTAGPYSTLTICPVDEAERTSLKVSGDKFIMLVSKAIGKMMYFRYLGRITFSSGKTSANKKKENECHTAKKITTRKSIKDKPISVA